MRGDGRRQDTMARMRLDHVSFAAEPDGLRATAERLSDLLGEKFLDGGIHPRFGTRNMVLPLTDGQYLEVVEVLDHPASDKAPFGQAVRARSESGGGWLGWVVAVDDIAPIEERIGRPAVDGHRVRPDGVDLTWKQLGVVDLLDDPSLPFFIQWTCADGQHPSQGHPSSVSAVAVEYSGDRDRLRDWLGGATISSGSLEAPFSGADITWVEDEEPGLVAVTFRNAKGELVRID